MAKTTKKELMEEKDPLLDVMETEETEAAESDATVEGDEQSLEPVEEATDGGRVEYILPRNVLSKDKHQVVILNGKAYQVEAGVRVKIPKGVAEILDHAVNQRLAYEDRVAAAQKGE